MAVTKALIYNQACSALKLTRQFVDPDTDETTNEKVNLDNHYLTALDMALADLDLESTAHQVTLALLSEYDDHSDDYPEWQYIYEFPDDCAKFRRIKSFLNKDVRSTRIPFIIRRFVDGATDVKAIFTNEPEALAEIITNDFPLANLSYQAGIAIAHKLAWLCAPLIVGKGAKNLQQEIEKSYLVHMASAQKLDQDENFNYEEDNISSEFVEARTD